ncbi:alpha-amylase family glycosyl hydrolase [Nonlabens ulvanivorans]|uniref:alpha-amylase family glycosyl hydrolase n=1 Tax=Nonlabens ulvanivorans TaxID=906888 RepID=UPI002941C6CF|nr:alpha-amylase family glycosyl hydrolase [Nonlabens ulvanivorans]WOI22686.1 alpha-amylase family glycosyl hydrolase [Nonlabens ulvanivorans]
MNKVVQILSVLFIIAFAKASLAQDIQRIEPPFWWAGMEKSEIQIMMYGEDLYNYEAISTDLNLIEINKTENENYLFITVDTKGFEAGTYVFNLESVDGVVEVMEYELLPREKESAQRKGFDSSDAIYLIMPDRFANGDSSNDSTDDTVEKVNRDFKGGRHGGDLQGVIDHLDYLEDLGVTSLWSTPLLEDNDKRYSYHTYAQSDLYKVDPRYGSNEDYKRLGDELHKRDMKLIMDYVTNHWGATHWMMQDLPTQTWIHQFDDNRGKDFPVAGYANSTYRQTTQMDPNVSQIDDTYAEKGWFVSTMPDINQGEPLALNYLIQNTIWWIEYAGLDGLRVDTYSYNEKEGIAAWTKAIMKEYPSFNIVGETWMHDQSQIAYWQKDSKIAAIQDYNTYLPSVMDFTLHDAIMKAFDEDQQNWDQGMIKVYDNFVNDFLYPDIDNILVFAGNHDTNRINGDGLYNGDLKKYKLAMTLVLTTRGIPQLYYGDEIGMAGNRDTDGDGDIRRDFPGGWNGDEINAFKNPTDYQKGFQDFTKRLLNYRKNKPVLHTGKLLQYVPENNCYVYFRYNDESRVMIIINNNPEAITLNLNRFKEGIDGKENGIDVLTNQKINLSDSVKVPGKTSMVIDLDNQKRKERFF